MVKKILSKQYEKDIIEPKIFFPKYNIVSFFIEKLFFINIL